MNNTDRERKTMNSLKHNNNSRVKRRLYDLSSSDETGNLFFSMIYKFII